MGRFFGSKNPSRAKSALPRPSSIGQRGSRTPARASISHRRPHPIRFERTSHAQHEDDAARARRLLPRPRRRSEKNANEADPQRRCRRARRRLSLGQVRRSHRAERCACAISRPKARHARIQPASWSPVALSTRPRASPRRDADSARETWLRYHRFETPTADPPPARFDRNPTGARPTPRRSSPRSAPPSPVRDRHPPPHPASHEIDASFPLH